MIGQEEKTQVVGLYSFPKSGNTWLRAIVAGATNMPTGPGVLQKYVTDSHFGKVIENPWHFQGTDWYFYKSHRKHVLREHEGQTFDTDKIVYIYRHPLDVFLSYVNFVSKNVSPAAGKSLNISFDTVEDLTPEQMEYLFDIFLEHATLVPANRAFGGVFEHIENFQRLAEAKGNVQIIRYEDLFDSFDETAGSIFEFLGFRDIDVESAYKFADNRTKQNGKFFWKRQKENFRNYLTDEQVSRFVDRHGDKMKALGYDTE